MLDLFNNQVVSVDIARDHGFLTGLGISPGQAGLNGTEATSGKYQGQLGGSGTYKIACQQPTQGAVPGGQSAMETCLSKDPKINVVYAINEPAAEGAAAALKAAHKTGVIVAAIDGGFFNQGEACTAASRILVQDSVYAEFEAKLCAAVSRLRVGDGADPATDVGPLVTRKQQNQVLDYLRIGVTEGARIAAQAPLPDDLRLADGFYVAPTVLTDVTPAMRVARDEIFGPVVTLIPFTDEDEAVRIANATQFGLVAAVFTQDSDRALRVSRRIRAGAVFVNNYHRISIGTGFGGIGHSGFGREHAQETLAEYGYTKTIRLAADRDELSYWSAATRVLAG